MQNADTKAYQNYLQITAAACLDAREADMLDQIQCHSGNADLCFKPIWGYVAYLEDPSPHLDPNGEDKSGQNPQKKNKFLQLVDWVAQVDYKTSNGERYYIYPEAKRLLDPPRSFTLLNWQNGPKRADFFLQCDLLPGLRMAALKISERFLDEITTQMRSKVSLGQFALGAIMDGSERPAPKS